jgi:transposase-like protein
VRQKFQIVIEALKGERQISEIAAQYQVHPNQISNWKKQFLANGANVFATKADDSKKELEKTQEELFKKIGQQQYEIEWLKKKLETCGVVEKRKMIEPAEKVLNLQAV